VYVDDPLWPVPTEATWDFAEAFCPESDAIMEARQRADELGVTAVSPAAGAALRMIAAMTHAKSIVEIGTGTGVTALWMLQGLREDGQLTSIDVEGEHHRIAREILAGADVPQGRVRLIAGRPAEILPRLQDGAYDVVLLNVEPSALNPMLDASLRLLRVGGIFAVSNSFANNKIGDPAQRDPATVARRLFAHRVADESRLIPAMLAVGDGLLVGVHFPAAE
jgi:predicted O-methyltransferase YrrM